MLLRICAIAMLGCAGCSSSVVLADGEAAGAAANGGPASSTTSCPSGAALHGVDYDISKSRFAFGSKPQRMDTGSMVRWVGAHGVVAIQPSGWEMGIMNAGAPEESLADWSPDADALGAHVKAYFLSMGAPACEVARVNVDGGSGGRTIALARAVEGIPVAESIAFAHFNANDESTSEGFFWPAVPADVVAAAESLHAQLADLAALAAYQAKLPEEARGEGQVVIHHSSSVATPPISAAATYDVDVTSALGGGTTESFDADGNAVTTTW